MTILELYKSFWAYMDHAQESLHVQSIYRNMYSCYNWLVCTVQKALPDGEAYRNMCGGHTGEGGLLFNFLCDILHPHSVYILNFLLKKSKYDVRRKINKTLSLIQCLWHAGNGLFCRDKRCSVGICNT